MSINITHKNTPPPDSSSHESQPTAPTGNVLTDPWVDDSTQDLHQQPCVAQPDFDSDNQAPTNFHQHLAQESHVSKGQEQDVDAELLSDIDSLKPGQLSKKYKGEYDSWRGMKNLCKKGKGVVHPSFEEFPSFLRIMGRKPHTSYSCDRIDNKNLEYSPDNCRWASKTLQTANKGNSVFLTVNGETLSVKAWADKLGISPGTIYARRSKHPDWPHAWQVYGKATQASAHSKPTNPHAFNDNHAVWNTCLRTHTDKSRFERAYLKTRQPPIPTNPDDLEPREVWLYRETRTKVIKLLNKISLNYDPCRPEQYPVPKHLTDELTACREVAKKARAYILSHHSRRAAEGYECWVEEVVQVDAEILP